LTYFLFGHLSEIWHSYRRAPSLFISHIAAASILRLAVKLKTFPQLRWAAIVTS